MTLDHKDGKMGLISNNCLFFYLQYNVMFIIIIIREPQFLSFFWFPL